MNDERTGQLTGDWRIPAYARGLLWLESDSGCVRVEGESGLFELNAPAQQLTLRWGGAEGPPLAQLRWQADSLGWEGAVRLGGYITSVHITELPDLELAVAVLTMEGFPLKPGVMPYVTPEQRKQVPYRAPDYHDGVDEAVGEGVTFWLAPDDSSLVTIAQDAMLHDRRVYCIGRLANTSEGWHTRFGMPLLLEAITLFGG